MMKKHQITSLSLLTTLALTLPSPLFAADNGILIFEDDFERTELQEVTDEIGEGWGTNSKSRAKANKQVDLKGGAMHITMHAEADHAVSVTHPAEFTDGSVELRFMLEDEKDTLLVEIEGDTVTASIDGKEAASFTSEGFAHSTKTMLRLGVPKSAVVDDVKIWKKM